MTEQSWRAIDDLVLKLYAAPDLGVLRRELMEGLKVLIPCPKGFFDLCDCTGGQFLFFEPVSLDMTAEELAAYYKRYQYSDYVAWIFTANEPTVYRDSSFIGDEARVRSAVYREWMEPMGVHFSMGSTQVHRGVMYGSITLFRARAEGDFTDEEMDMLRILNRHLSATLSQRYPNGLKRGGEEGETLSHRYRLTEREGEIMALLVDGLGNQEIGKRLYITENTVKKHVGSLYHKLGITSRRQLMPLVYRGASLLVQPSAPT